MDHFLEDIEWILVQTSTDDLDLDNFPVYLGHMPDSTVAAFTDKAVALLNTLGGADYGRVEIEEPGLQILVRGASIYQQSSGYEEAFSAAHQIKNALHGFSGPTSSGKNVVGIWNQSGPFFLGFDQEMRPNFSNNFRVMRSRT